jgi:hypothetical protein
VTGRVFYLFFFTQNYSRISETVGEMGNTRTMKVKRGNPSPLGKDCCPLGGCPQRGGCWSWKGAGKGGGGEVLGGQGPKWAEHWWVALQGAEKGEDRAGQGQRGAG